MTPIRGRHRQLGVAVDAQTRRLEPVDELDVLTGGQCAETAHRPVRVCPEAHVGAVNVIVARPF